jgi:hypothetical protein
MLMT